MAQNRRFRYDVFLSHSWRNKPWVREFAEQLQALKLKVFFDERSIEAGDDISDEIRDALQASRTLVFLISPASASSFYVHMEVAGALMRTQVMRDVRLIPVVLEKTNTSQFPAPFHNKKSVDLTDAATRIENYQSLLKSLIENAGYKVHMPLPPPPPFRLTRSFDPAPGGHVYAIGAHWDDILLGCFGTLLKLKLIFGYRVEVLVLCTHYGHGYFGHDQEVSERAGAIYEVVKRQFGIVCNFVHKSHSQTTISDREFNQSYSILNQVLDDHAKKHEDCNLILTPPTDDRHEDHAITGKLAMSHFRKPHQTVLEYEIKPHSDRVFVPNIFVGLSEKVEDLSSNHKSGKPDLISIAELKVKTLTQLILGNSGTSIEGAELHFEDEILKARMRINALDYGGNREVQYGEAFRGTIHL